MFESQTKTIMTQQPKRKPADNASASAGLYDLHGPIPVPEASESDSESAWAMFQQSVIATEERVAVAAELAAAKAKDDTEASSGSASEPSAGDSGFADTNFEPTNFSDLPFDATALTPLKP